MTEALRPNEIMDRERWIDSYRIHLAICFLRDCGKLAEFAEYLERCAEVENADD